MIMRQGSGMARILVILRPTALSIKLESATDGNPQWRRPARRTGGPAGQPTTSGGSNRRSLPVLPRQTQCRNHHAQFALKIGSAASEEQAMSENQRKRRWSAEVTAHSDALDLEPDVFEKENAAEVARSLKRSAEASDRRKSSPYRSAMSMLTFYINRAGRNLPPERKQTLEAAKGRLRELFRRNR
jgi:hypothetical protein